MLLCREEGLTSHSPPLRCLSQVCLTKGHTTRLLPVVPVFAHHRGRGLQAHEEPTNGCSFQAAGKTEPYLLRQAPPFPWGAAMQVPAPDPSGCSQTALLSDKGEPRLHQKENPPRGGKQKRGSSLYLTPPHCCSCLPDIKSTQMSVCRGSWLGGPGPSAGSGDVTDR